MHHFLTQGTRRVGVPILAALALFGSIPAEADGTDFADMVEQVLPAVVHISIESRQTGVFNPGSRDQINPFHPGDSDQRGGPQTVVATGSGFIVDADGYVVTNNHVIEDAQFISVTLADGEDYDATLVGSDPGTDIAVLKIEGDDAFPTVGWGDSESLRIGNWVVAVGGPYGLSGTVTAGIVSATGRDLHAGPYDDFLQFDAQINPGNSGGPVFNTDGQVIGVSTAIVSPSHGSVGIGFAVPSAMAQPVVAALIDHGMVARGYLGVRIQHVTDDLASALGLDEPMGALVAAVQPGSAAERAGVQVGDLIVAFDGAPVGQMRDLPRIVGMTAPGATVQMQVLRDGEPETLSVTIGEIASAAEPDQPPPVRTGNAVSDLGLVVATASDYGWRGAHGEADGVVITDVASGSAAQASGLRVGDVILAVGGEIVGTPADLDAVITARANETDQVAMLVERDGDRRFIPLKLNAS